MRKKFLFLVICIFILILNGCQPGNTVIQNTPPSQISKTSTSTPQPSPQLTLEKPTSTSTRVPSQVSVTKTPSPSMTPTVELPSQPPYLVIHREVGTFTFYGPDGRGQKQVQVPNIGKFWVHYKPTNLVSPSGEWIAFFQGNPDDPPDLTLCLYNVKDGSVVQLTRLYAGDYLDRLADLAVEIDTRYPDRYAPDVDSVDIVSMLINDIHYNLEHLAWSPDNRYLAFAALLDGLSSDLYLYDFRTKEIKRLTSDVGNIAHIEWSLDSKYILYENSIPDQVYSPSTLHVTQPEKLLPKAYAGIVEYPVLESLWCEKEGWIAPNLFMTFNSGGDTAPKARLGYRNLDTFVKQVIWKDIYNEFAIDPDYRLIAISTEPSIFGSDDPALDRPEDGTYLLKLDGKYIKVSDSVLKKLTFRGGNLSRFIGEDQQGQTVAISNTGTIKVIGNRPEPRFSVSPDRLLLAVENSEGIDIYDQEDQLINTINISNLWDMIWGTDSRSIFYTVNGKSLYYLSLQQVTPVLVDECSLPDCLNHLKNNARWIE